VTRFSRAVSKTAPVSAIFHLASFEILQPYCDFAVFVKVSALISLLSRVIKH
jgi:hypothetical protein